MNPATLAALVTGGASGLGLAVGVRLSGAGARVALLDLPGSVGAQAASSCGALFTPADVTREAEVCSALDRVAAELGELRVLVHCAGVGFSANTLSWNGPSRLEDFARVVQVNLIGAYNCVRLAAARMAKNPPNAEGERGVIILTASAAAFDGQIGQAAYSASKAGIVGMTLPLARDLAEHAIRVVTIAPGLFDTPMLAGLPEPLKASLLKQSLFPRRLGRPEEFAALVQHVIENPMINAETIRLDAGLRLSPR